METHVFPQENYDIAKKERQNREDCEKSNKID